MYYDNIIYEGEKKEKCSPGRAWINERNSPSFGERRGRLSLQCKAEA
jgi:hypothetical protein